MNVFVCECMQNGVFEYVCEWVYMSVFVCDSIVYVCVNVFVRERRRICACVWCCMNEGVWVRMCESIHVWVNVWVCMCLSVCKKCVCLNGVCLMVHVGVYVCKSMCLWVCVWRSVFQCLCNTAHIDHNSEIHISIVFHQF
jgi:hypothetical protein